LLLYLSKGKRTWKNTSASDCTESLEKLTFFK